MNQRQSDLCPHGRQTGSYQRGLKLGAFVEPPLAGAVQQSVDTGLPLVGLRIAIKDNIDVEGWVTAAGSRALPSHVASADAPVVARLRAAGALIDAKTRLDEFAITTFGPEMSHPSDPARSVGGSSGGSGLAVAAGGYCAAVGTDTGAAYGYPRRTAAWWGSNLPSARCPWRTSFPCLRRSITSACSPAASRWPVSCSVRPETAHRVPPARGAWTRPGTGVHLQPRPRSLTGCPGWVPALNLLAKRVPRGHECAPRRGTPRPCRRVRARSP